MQSCTSAAPTVSEMPTGRMRGGRDRRPNITCRSTIAYHLGSTNPCPSADYMEPFSTLVFKFLVWIFATTTKNCSRGHFNWIHTQILFATSTTAYSLMHRIYINGKLWSIGRSLQASASSIFKANSFGRWVLKRISTSMTTVLLSSEPTPFRHRSLFRFWSNRYSLTQIFTWECLLANSDSNRSLETLISGGIVDVSIEFHHL